jgi:hypothetical protein
MSNQNPKPQAPAKVGVVLHGNRLFHLSVNEPHKQMFRDEFPVLRSLQTKVLTLKPGLNFLDAGDAEATGINKMDAAMRRVLSVAVPQNISVYQALDLVEKTASIDALQEWARVDSRDEIQEKIKEVLSSRRKAA